MFIDGIDIDTRYLDDAITRVLDEMAQHPCESDEFEQLVDQLTKLYKLKETEYNIQLKVHDQTNKNRENDARIELIEADIDTKKVATENFGKISNETWATIGANLLGIVLVLGHERAHVITTKAFGLISKIR